jgi:hypothetical protein
MRASRSPFCTVHDAAEFLGELVEDLGDGGELLQRHRLQGLFHLGEAEGVVVLVLFLDAAGAALDQRILVLIARFWFFLDLVLVLEARAGGLFGDFAVVVAVFVIGEAFGGGVFREHRIEIENLAQLHLAIVERGRPFDDRVEGGRAFAQPEDHGVAARLDALGDRDLAFA